MSRAISLVALRRGIEPRRPRARAALLHEGIDDPEILGRPVLLQALAEEGEAGGASRRRGVLPAGAVVVVVPRDFESIGGVRAHRVQRLHQIPERDGFVSSLASQKLRAG